MSWLYDPMKPMSEKTAADWATDYMIYEEVTKDWDSDSGDGNSPEPPSGTPSGCGCGGGGCGSILLATILVVLGLALFSLLLDTCWSGSSHTTTRYVFAWETSTTTGSTTHSYPTQSAYRSTTYSYRYTTHRYTTRDDPYDAHGYIDADDFAAENWEEFDDYDEAYDYYEDYMAGYDLIAKK